jgi:hypothetical protein
MSRPQGPQTTRRDSPSCSTYGAMTESNASKTEGYLADGDRDCPAGHPADLWPAATVAAAPMPARTVGEICQEQPSLVARSTETTAPAPGSGPRRRCLPVTDLGNTRCPSQMGGPDHNLYVDLGRDILTSLSLTCQTHSILGSSEDLERSARAPLQLTAKLARAADCHLASAAWLDAGP